MSSAAIQFNQNMARAREITALATQVSKLATPVIDITDLYRASIVHGVSALDHFVHEFVRIGMTQVHRGERITTNAHLAFRVPLSVVRVATVDVSDDTWLDTIVRSSHAWLSFQHPDKIADAVRLISNVSLWDEVGKVVGLSAKEVKDTLRLIVDRRNQIAHEADLNPAIPGERWPITSEIVIEALDFIDAVVKAIDQVAA